MVENKKVKKIKMADGKHHRFKMINDRDLTKSSKCVFLCMVVGVLVHRHTRVTSSPRYIASIKCAKYHYNEALLSVSAVTDIGIPVVPSV